MGRRFAREGTDGMAGEQVRDDAIGARPGLLSGLGSRWRWIAGGTLAALIGSTAFVLVAPPRYVAVATVRLGESERSVPNRAAAPKEGEDQAESLVLADLARAAVDRLGLAQNPEFAADGASGRSPADTFLSRLTLTPAAGPRAIAITFAARDPAVATRGANTVAELAVRSLNEARARSARAVETWVAGRIEDSKAKVADAEAKVEAARSASRLPAGGDEQRAAAVRASDLDARLSAARAKADAAAGKASLLRNLEREGRLADARPPIADEPLRRLLDQRVALKAEIAEASRTLLPLHPRMRELSGRLAALEGELRVAADEAARASDDEARRAQAEADSIASTLAEQSRGAAAASGAEASLKAVEVAAQSARDELASYQQMAREGEARRAAEAEEGDARILERAEPPLAPVFPKVAPNLVAGAAAGFTLSGLAAAVAALIAARRRPNVPSQVVTVKPTAPDAAAESDSPGLLDAAEPASNARPPGGALDSAAALVATLRRAKPHGGLVALVAGDRAGQALSVALESARRLAAERAAVFVDLGDTQDWLADILYREAPDEPAIPGLSDLIAGRVGFGDVIRRDLSSKLDVVLPGHDRAGGHIEEALTAFAAAYGAVVLHTSDWRSDWARAAAGLSDAVIVVAPAARAGAVLEQARSVFADRCPTVVAYALRALQRLPEAA